MVTVVFCSVCSVGWSGGRLVGVAVVCEWPVWPALDEAAPEDDEVLDEDGEWDGAYYVRDTDEYGGDRGGLGYVM